MGIGEALPMALPSRSRHQPVTSLDEELWLSASVHGRHRVFDGTVPSAYRVSTSACRLVNNCLDSPLSHCTTDRLLIVIDTVKCRHLAVELSRLWQSGAACALLLRPLWQLRPCVRRSACVKLQSCKFCLKVVINVLSLMKSWLN